MLSLSGRLGKTVIVDGSTVKIAKKGGIFATQRDRTIPIRNITSVEVKKPGPLVVGFIQFSIAGGAVRDASWTYTGGAFDAVNDENSVVFADLESYEIALQIKSYVENFHDTPATFTQTSDDNISKIERLAALMRQGVLSEEEFTQEKAKILGQTSSTIPPRQVTPLVTRLDAALCPFCRNRVPLSSLRMGDDRCPHCGHCLR